MQRFLLRSLHSSVCPNQLVGAQAVGAAAFNAAAVPARDAVFFSSTAAVWSQSGAGHYAAANCALDGLAQRRWHAGLPAVALQLGPFRDTGMAAQHSGSLAALGLQSLWPHEVRRLALPLLRPGACVEAVFVCDAAAGAPATCAWRTALGR